MEPRAALPSDLKRLLPLVEAFWTFEKLPWDRVDVPSVLATLLGDPSIGRVLVVERGGELVGYLALVFGFSLEHGGRDSLIDELYVIPSLRNRGLGTQLIEAAAVMMRGMGIHRMHLEVDHANPRAHALYARMGFKGAERELLTRAF